MSRREGRPLPLDWTPGLQRSHDPQHPDCDEVCWAVCVGTDLVFSSRWFDDDEACINDFNATMQAMGYRERMIYSPVGGS